ncbi:MAG: hypothetical protein ABSC42_10685 [Tepidisphaeraceae bacterium]
MRSDPPIAARAIAWAFCALTVVCAGCQTAHVNSSLTAKFSGNDADAQLNFWHELANRHLTSNDEALHGLLLYADGRDDANTYDKRVATLKSRGLLAASFSEPANDAIRRGDLAVAIVNLLGIKGGWVMHIFGPTPRYAVRELVYAGIFPPSSPQQTFSGAEFVGVIGKLDDYQQPVVADASVR